MKTSCINSNWAKLNLGDEVVISNRGLCYSTYYDFFKENDLSNHNWKNGDSLENGWRGVIVGFGKHNVTDEDIAVVYIIEKRQKYLIDIDGLEIRGVQMTQTEIEKALGYKIEIVDIE